MPKLLKFFSNPLHAVGIFLVTAILLLIIFYDYNVLFTWNIIAILLVISAVIYIGISKSLALFQKAGNRHEFIIENSKDLIWILDAETLQFKYVSGACLQDTGYTFDEHKELTLNDILPPNQLQKALILYNDGLNLFKQDRVKVQKTFEIQRYHKSGSTYWVEVSATVLSCEMDSSCTTIVGFERNIEERKRLEEYILSQHNELQASEEKYRYITENSRDFIWAIDPYNLNYIFVSDACLRYTGHTKIEHLSLNLRDTLPPTYLLFARQLIDESFEIFEKYRRQHEMTFEIERYHKDGSTYWIEVSARAQVDERSNQIVSIIGVERKIEKRKKLEALILKQHTDIKTSEEKYRFITENSNDLITRVEVSDLRFSFVSEVCYKITGFTQEEHLKFFLVDIVLPTDYQKILEFKEEGLELFQKENKNHAATFELQRYHKKGHLYWVEVSTRMVDGTFFVSTERNIDDRKRLLWELQKSEEKYQYVAENTKDLLCTLDFNTLQYLYINEACITDTGYSKEEHLKLTLWDISPKENYPQIKAILNEALQLHATEGKNYNFIYEFQRYHKDGTLYWVEVSASVVDVSKIISVQRKIEKRKNLELALKESEKKFAIITENSNDLIWIIDAKTKRYIYQSDIGPAFHGYSLEEVYNNDRSYYNSLPSNWIEFVEGIIAAQTEKYKKGEVDKISAQFEVPLRHKNGSVYWAEISASATIDENCIPMEYFGITRNIEKRKNLELALKDTEKRFAAITEHSNDLIWILDAKTMKYTYQSDAGAAIHGYSLEDIKANKRDFYNTTSPDNSKFVLNLIEELTHQFKQGEIPKYSTTFEIQILRKDRTPLWVEVSASATTDDDGNPIEFYGITRNIEERKKMELALIESDNKYTLIADTIKDYICNIEIQTLEFSFVVGASESITGYTPDEFLHTLKLKDCFSQNYFDVIIFTLTEGLRKYSEDPNYVPHANLEIKQKHKNGSEVWVEVSADMIFNQQKRPDKIIAIVRQIEERKAAEMQILIQKEELEKANATKDKFFSIIAHDLKNPLSGTLSLSEYLLANAKKYQLNDLEEDVFMLVDTLKHTYGLLENLLAWSRSSMGTITFNPDTFDINRIINDCTGFLSAQAIAKQININFNAPNEACNVVCDYNMILTIIRNLVSNAIKFSASGSSIDINVTDYSEDNNYFLISVKDYGNGISEDNLAKLFRIDEKVVSTVGTNNEGGTGLGLILCKEFIDKHNCKIWVESQLTMGSTFFFTLEKS